MSWGDNTLFLPGVTLATGLPAEELLPREMGREGGALEGSEGGVDEAREGGVAEQGAGGA